MTVTFQIDESSSASPEELLRFAESDFNPADSKSMMMAVRMMRRLYNNRQFLFDIVVERLAQIAEGKDLSDLSQSIVIGARNGYLLRANIWPPLNLSKATDQDTEPYSYDRPHDHNFSFLTLGYMGGGYTTDLYSYDRSQVRGYGGEKVELTFSERTSLTPGKIMLFESGKDVHTQVPPATYSVSINLMWTPPGHRDHDQFFFDLDASQIADFPNGQSNSSRMLLITAAGWLGDPESIGVIEHLCRHHPSRRVRVHSALTLQAIHGARGASWKEFASRDDSPYIELELSRLRQLGRLI